ncbi:Aldo/keto reductase family protein [Pseudoloma neurophilia]|uniref:Aldo/keto reductase family protein n=1 Tax=Pseudoloma neurophilia TaxID=146866 RepID=A0A0R0M820_9MICR|nr:Aldo/keto reductase family protein [Pseudoloma neurophilia]
MIPDNLKMNNGLSIPKKAFGTWNLNGQDTVTEILEGAIRAGFRHLDFALTYENEKEVGVALQEIFKKGLVKREDLFLTSKLWNTWHDHVDEAIEKTLSDLQLDYLDLYLIHWSLHIKPDAEMQSTWVDNKLILNEFNLEKLWPKMESLVERGLVRSIGISNFGVKNIKKTWEVAKIKPVCNQIELHPFLQQKEVVKQCQEYNIAVSCHSSLRSLPDIKKDGFGKELIQISEKRNCSPSTIIISFLIQKGYIVITKTSTKERIASNYNTITLSEEEMLIIENIQDIKRYAIITGYGSDVFD